MNLKKQRFILLLIILISFTFHFIYGLEGARQVQAYEQEIHRLKQHAKFLSGQAVRKESMYFQMRDSYVILKEKYQTYLDLQPKHIGEFEITYYCPCTKCCGPDAVGITYSGTIAEQGRTVAVDPNVIPLGSTIIIDGHAFTAEDTGGAIKGNIIDIFVNSHEYALELGRHKADVWIVNEEKGGD